MFRVPSIQACATAASTPSGISTIAMQRRTFKVRPSLAQATCPRHLADSVPGMDVAAGTRRDDERWVFTGRESELNHCLHVLSSPSSPAGVILVGRAGVGKSRLSREVMRRSNAASVVSVVGSDAARRIPFGAFAGVPAVAELSGSPSGPAALIAAVVERMHGAAHGGLLNVDDAHLLDDMSLLLVQQLALAGGIRLLLTARSDDHMPPTLTSLWKDCLLSRTEVEPLGRAATGRLISTVLRGPADRASGDRLFERSTGNPLYLRLLVEDALASGELVERTGVWRLESTRSLPTTLTELISARIGLVPDVIADVVDALALVEPLSVVTLAAVTSAGAIEDAENIGIVTVDAIGARLAHPLYAEVRRDAMGEMRARRLRGELVRAMAATGSGHTDDVLLRASLSIDADEPTPLALLLAALLRSGELLDVPLTLRLGKRAITEGADWEVQAVVANAAELVPGEDPLAELELLAQMANDDQQRSRAAIMRVMHHAWAVTEPDQAFAQVSQIRTVVSDPSALAQVDSIESLLLAHQGRPQEAIALAERALAVGGEQGDTVIVACCALVAAFAVRGDADRIDATVARGLSHPGVLGTAILRSPLVAVQVMGHRIAGHLAHSDELTRALVQTIDAGTTGAMVVATMQGMAELAGGHPATALRLLQETMPALDTTDFGGWRYLAGIALAQATALRGSREDAVRASQQLDERAHATMRFWDPERVLTHAMAAARTGTLADALVLCEAAAAVASSQHQWGSEVLAWQQAAQYGSHAGTDRLMELARIVDGPRVSVALAHSVAVGAADAVALATVATQWEQIGDLIAAADAAAQAFRMTPDQASVHARARRHALQRRVADLLERSEHPHTPESMMFKHPLPLTQRERDIAVLVRLGLSNRQIAERLVVSVRTVEGHVYRATVKLGVTRKELGDLVAGE